MGILKLRLIILLSGFCICLLRPISSQVSFTPKTAILFPGGNVTFMCNNTNKFWLINDTDTRRTDNELAAIDGVTSTGPQLLTLVITQSANDTLYGCGVLMMGDFVSDTGVVYVATVPDQVPTPVIDAATLENDMVNITLSWGEPFNNFDPIINYTVMCSGDDQCPDDFTTTDNTTRSYTITNLTSMTTYTFSVVATNSIGSGEAGVMMITTPSLPGIVTGVNLTCDVEDQNNQCIVEWDPITVGNGPLEQPLVYEVYYNGTMKNVTSPTTELPFTAPPLPDEVFADNITVTVTAINIFGRGTPSDPDSTEIMASSVTDVMITPIDPDVVNLTYSINVTCTIDPESLADMCVVMAVSASGLSVEGVALITNRMATITLKGLRCEVTYTIIAGGTLGGDLVGPTASLGIVTVGSCPEMTSSLEPTSSMGTASSSGTPIPSDGPTGPVSDDDDDDNTGAIVGGVVGGICGFILLIVLIILIWFCWKRNSGAKSSRATSPGGEKGGAGVKVHTLDRYGKPIPLEGENTDTGVELTGYTAKSPEFTVSQVPSTAPATTFQGNDYQTDEKNRVASTYGPEGSYDTLAPAEEPTAPSAEVVPPAQNGQSNPNAPKLNYADLEQFTRKPASVKKPEPQPASQYAVIDPKSLQQGTYT